MKKISFSFCFFLLCTALLFSQEKPSADQVKHYSSDETSFQGHKIEVTPIGTSSCPVTVEEYCDFLNDTAFMDHAWICSIYYEPSFMKTDHDFGAAPHACIYRKGNAPHYRYTVIPGHEHDIIDAVTAPVDARDRSVAKQFKVWRKYVRQYDY